jgi:predicted transcriptional regulator
MADGQAGRPRHKIRNNVQPVRIPDPVKKRMDKLARRKPQTNRSAIINRAVLELLNREGV